MSRSLSAENFYSKEEPSVTDNSGQKHAKQAAIPASFPTYKDLNVKEGGQNWF